MYAVELAKSLRRGRSWLLASIVASVPIVIVLAVRMNPPRPGASSSSTPFLFPIVVNGFYAALSALSVIQPYLLPVITGLLVGDAIAGEAQAGTLRALLVRPVSRGRLVLAKYAAAMTFVAALVAVTLGAGVIAGGTAFGLGPMPTLSGTSLSTAAASGRLALSAAFIVAEVSGVASIGIWISTRTDNGPVAAVITAAIAIVSQILDRIPSLVRLGGYLPTHGWTGYVGLFRYPIDLIEIRRGLVISAAYTVLFLTLAVVGFQERDITS
jgi:ABC-2 type transport system permease protein